VKPCIFCSIARGETKAHFVLDEPDVLGFLDTRPVFKGHVLIIPREHIETLADLDPAMLAPLFGRVQSVMRAVEEGLGADGTFVATNNKVSQSVPHLHVHVVPRKQKDGLKGFFWPRTKYASEEEAAEVASVLSRHVR
jgi:histidine triad (HIT) family protein